MEEEKDVDPRTKKQCVVIQYLQNAQTTRRTDRHIKETKDKEKLSSSRGIELCQDASKERRNKMLVAHLYLRQATFTNPSQCPPPTITAETKDETLQPAAIKNKSKETKPANISLIGRVSETKPNMLPVRKKMHNKRV